MSDTELKAVEIKYGDNTHSIVSGTRNEIETLRIISGDSDYKIMEEIDDGEFYALHAHLCGLSRMDNLKQQFNLT